ncbi:HAMP domain-containing sensor histidine kinase [Aquimarina sp. I32.4]|uniref:sensor histidine kinase n=1 Tax=Aquimarina sp. I32.4 TaxID=2053903 RepID=UPI000CDF004F|nr:HAMP domain-containing sensor histidine kinase [Aquimarina sp. I32.4]
MKLLILSNRYYFVGLLVVSLLGGISSYFLIESIINRDFNQKLLAEKEQLIYELHEYDDLLDNLYLNIGDRISLQKQLYDPKIKTYIKDTILFNFYDQKEQSFRQITFSDQVKGDYYKITISKSLLSSRDLVQGVTEIVSLITFLFFITMLLLNNAISKKIWKPFYHTIAIIKNLNIVKPQPLLFRKTKIIEFKELNSTIEIMSIQMVKDYINLKEYIENTSHEIQTPIAIIKNKIEILMQDKNLLENQLTTLNQIHEYAGRISKLKENLSLLSKIDNNQFINTIEIPITDYLKQRIDDVKELIIIKNINTTLHLKKKPVIKMNETLAYLLFSNLLSNAIKHNTNKGKIVIEIADDFLSIKNTGEPLDVNPDELFGRFKKSGNRPDSTGLGLSLVHSIASYYNFSISYTNKNIWHTIVLRFYSNSYS